MRDKLIYITKAALRWLYWLPADLLQRRSRAGSLTPPRRISFVGRGDSEQAGREFLGHFVELGGLRADQRVLDIGCGIGRMALPLAQDLGTESYAGFDVGRGMIRWCSRQITPRYPGFEFSWAPIFNGKYNPFGTVTATEFRFPYPDSSFDFAFATSVFTHLLADEVRHYLAETSRVLRPGSSCLLTFFLLTPESEAELAAGRAALPFRHPVDHGLTTDRHTPEEAVAYRVADLRAMFAESGLEIRDPIHRGGWANAPGAPSGQDIIVATRPA